MTPFVDAPANPRCLICISTPKAGGAVNVITLPTNEYDLGVAASPACWTTPLSVTKILWPLGGIFERVNVSVLPSPT